MGKSKRKSKAIKDNSALQTGIVVGLLVVAVAMLLVQQRRLDALTINRDRWLAASTRPNPACAGVSNPIWQKKFVDKLELSVTTAVYDKEDFENKDSKGILSIANCFIGGNTRTVTKGTKVAEIDSNGLDFGAQVIYFESDQKASAYADSVVNPQRFWSEPNNDLTKEVPANKYFTSYVDGSIFYFDAYAVKENKVLRVTLPCGNVKTSDANKQKCSGESVDEGLAISVLKDFVESVDVTN
jgi:hypothetical protein